MLDLRELQKLTNAEFSVERSRKLMMDIVNFYKSKDYYNEAIDIIVLKERGLTRDIAEKMNVFFVDDDETIDNLPEELRSESLGFVRGRHIVFSGRLVYPVMDVKGQVMGFCGWDKFEQPKYLDSKNNGYKAKETTLYGMEELPLYYKNKEPIYFVEGIVCCLYLRSQGFQALAYLGSNISKYIIEIMKRVEDRAIAIPDNDVINKTAEDISTNKPAGEHLVKIIKSKLPKARIIQSRIAKDVDDTRLYENHKYEQRFLSELRQVAVCPYFMFETIIVR